MQSACGTRRNHNEPVRRQGIATLLMRQVGKLNFNGPGNDARHGVITLTLEWQIFGASTREDGAASPLAQGVTGEKYTGFVANPSKTRTDAHAPARASVWLLPCRLWRQLEAGAGGGTMRSELVMGASKHIPNRYLLTHLAAKAIRAFHRPNSRIADTANDVLQRFSTKNPIALRPISFPLSRPELRRAS